MKPELTAWLPPEALDILSGALGPSVGYKLLVNFLNFKVCNV